ncbi:hypothetical protein HP548_29500 [Paenibacillus taichungensis]|uniref:Uncharacterized protein n=1 Tax=Paenibacillus taichungensis TaxID=484184 RepID=A0ABX2MVU8_9BACL|nr:hypothetical protein [Paenibacillus taichungensis]NUU58227.1 hypothetical protein [Paenibacillus taichungensis]
MPTLDNYSLGNYGLGGFGGIRYNSVQLIDQNAAYSIPGNSSDPVIAYDTGIRFNAGTKLITIAPVNTSAKFNISPAPNVYGQWALADANNVIWPLTVGTNSQMYSYNSLIVDLGTDSSSASYNPSNYGFFSNAGQWVLHTTSKPSLFNKESEMKFVAVGANFNTNKNNITVIVSGVRVISA